MVGNLLLRGMIVGLLAGLLAFGFARIVGEPQVDRAIGFEEAMSASGDAGHDHGHEVELVSRATQAGLGLFTGVVIYGTAMGGLLALVFAWVQGRFSRLDPRATAALLALGGFVAIVLVPGLKYPANPPAVGNGDTIGYRTQLFFMMLALSIVGLGLAAGLARRLWDGHGAWNALIFAGAAYVLGMVLVMRALPAVNEVPEGFPADLLWSFRVAAIGIQAILWAVIGLGFGALAERRLTPELRISAR